MGEDVLDFRDPDCRRTELVGGKGANLARLAQIDGIDVPPGFCVTADAFARVVSQAPSLTARLERLAALAPDDRASIRELSAEIRAAVEDIAIPDELSAAIARGLARLGEPTACAVRSSATAEDLPSASFAGQHDSYLNVAPDEVAEHVRRCWASLFTERAVAYRRHHEFDHRAVRMAVVVQRMVPAEAAGVLFTADPVTGHRRVAAIDAVPGLGEALVSGRVTPDVFKVRAGELVERSPAGERPVLTDAQALAVVALGRRIEAHFGRPQDIEWCLVDGGFSILQSRPITTLFPIPDVGDGAGHVFVSVGHQQMMTDAMKPFGLSLFQLTTRAEMYDAGGRLFVDVGPRMASPATRAGLMKVLGTSDPLIGGALQTILDRGDPVLPVPEQEPRPVLPPEPPIPLPTDPAIVTELIAANEASVAALARDIRAPRGAELLDFIRADIAELQRVLFDPRSHQAIMAGMNAAWWLNDHVGEWLGERNVADTLTQSVPHNVTSEMGLALLDVADAIRPHPAVVAYLETVEGDDFLDDLAALDGGREARDAIVAYLDAYGMRCTGEIDISRPRWRDRPATLVPMILSNVRNFEPGAGQRRLAQGAREAADKEREVLARLRALPDGEEKAAQAKEKIDRVRTFAGYREYPKYGMICRYGLYRQALLAQADALARAGVIADPDDIFLLTFDELRSALGARGFDPQLIRERREAFAGFQSLTPPRVLTSDGEVVIGAYGRDGVPTGALVGLPVSAGTIEGRARVIDDVAQADLAPGDILVTAYTDPSWATLFVAVSGLVTEVGGQMTHGAVIAREYGLPAVVGVQNATELIEDGQRIRVHGTEGYVELLT